MGSNKSGCSQGLICHGATPALDVNLAVNQKLLLPPLSLDRLFEPKHEFSMFVSTLVFVNTLRHQTLISCDMFFTLFFLSQKAEAPKANSLARHSQMFATTEQPNEAIERLLWFCTQ